MDTNAEELAFAIRSLTIMEEALQALREQLRTQNPDLLEVTSRLLRKAYCLAAIRNCAG